MGGSNAVVKCNDGGCVMQKLHGIPHDYDGEPRCDSCGISGLHNFEFFYHCDQHDYDLCRVCASVQTRQLKVDENGKMLIRGHACAMTYDPHCDRHWGGHGCDA